LRARDGEHRVRVQPNTHDHRVRKRDCHPSIRKPNNLAGPSTIFAN
jgi:hypothetical protein